MKTLLFCFLLISMSISAQELKFKKNSLVVDEPFNTSQLQTSNIIVEVEFECNSCSGYTTESPLNFKLRQTSSSSFKGLFKTTPSDLDNLSYPKDKKMTFTIGTSLADKNEVIELQLLYSLPGKDTITDKMTITVKNTFPAVAATEGNDRPWDEARIAEVFLGTNFDFFDKNVKLTDWYGGVRLFLPNITRVKLSKKSSEPRLGVLAGFYQNKSFSQLAYPSLNSSTSDRVGIFERIVSDSQSNGQRLFRIERDSMSIKFERQIRNFGLYAGLIWQFNKPDVVVKDGIFNFYVGFTAEVIRRYVTTSYNIDTLKIAFQTFERSTRGGSIAISAYPDSSGRLYTDAYFGITFPLQYMYRNQFDLRISPTFGMSNTQFLVNPGKVSAYDNTLPSQKFFYLCQFDLLARLGGLSLNLGGEVRGYFPKDPPIINIYLGTSFSIKKLVDFISK